MVLLLIFAVLISHHDLLALLAHINMHMKCSPSHNYCKTYLLGSQKMTELAGFIHAKIHRRTFLL